MKLGTALGVVLDTPEDMKKFGYNPTTSSGTVNTGHDPVKAALTDAFGVGVSGHIVASIAANVLSRVFVAVKRKVTGAEAATDPYQELAEFIEAVYDMIFEELGLDGDRPKADGIAAKLRQLLKQSAGEETGLVEKEVTVHRDGKTFKQKRMVRTGSPTVHGAHELSGKRAGSDKAALQKFAEIAPTADAKEAVLDAEYNVPKGDSARDYEPIERRVYTAERLGAAWRDTLERGDKESAAYLEEVMSHFNMELYGPAVGEEIDFDGRYYDSDDSILSGPAKVVRPPVVVHTPDGKHIATKGKAAKVARD